MKVLLALLVVVVGLLALFWILSLATDLTPQRPRTDLPWQVQPYPDGTSQVFDLHLGQATLADAVVKFGPYEQMAIFASEGADPVLEAYFGTVRLGPLQAKVVVSLAADSQALATLIAASPERKGSPTGDWKFPLGKDASAAQHDRIVQAITYIPSYGGLEADDFRERFGEPSGWKRLDEHSVQWFYPIKGLSLLLNSKGREVLEFVPPRAMQVPEDAEYARPPTAD